MQRELEYSQGKRPDPIENSLGGVCTICCEEDV
jgi:hypothetical protein